MPDCGSRWGDGKGAPGALVGKDGGTPGARAERPKATAGSPWPARNRLQRGNGRRSAVTGVKRFEQRERRAIAVTAYPSPNGGAVSNRSTFVFLGLLIVVSALVRDYWWWWGSRAIEHAFAAPDVTWRCGDYSNENVREILHGLPPLADVGCAQALQHDGACCIASFEGGVEMEIHVFRGGKGYEVHLASFPYRPSDDLASLTP